MKDFFIIPANFLRLMTFYLKTFYSKVINLLSYILVLKNSKTCAPTGKRPALKKLIIYRPITWQKKELLLFMRYQMWYKDESRGLTETLIWSHWAIYWQISHFPWSNCKRVSRWLFNAFSYSINGGRRGIAFIIF